MNGVYGLLRTIDHIQRRLHAIGYGAKQRERLRLYRPLVDSLIDKLVIADFERAFTIHSELRALVEPVAGVLYPASAAHFRLLFEGCGANGSGLGFDDLLVSVDQAELAGDMKTALANAIAALDAIDELSIEAAMLSDAASVQALYDAIKALTDLLKTDFVTVLDLARPMGAEGDND